MKKKVLFLLIPLLVMGMTGCVKYNGEGKNGPRSSSSPSQSQPSSGGEQSSGGSQGGESSGSTPAPVNPDSGSELPVGTSVKVYLAFGEYGKYQGSFVTNHIDAIFLEHAIEFSAKVGDDLPGKTDVTSSVTNSEFVSWIAYNNDGKLTEYTKVPGYNGKILYASFSGGSGTAHNPVIPSPDYAPSSTGDLPTSSFGLKFSDNSFMVGERTEDNDGFQQYVIRKKAFKKDQIFQLCDFGHNAATWTVNIDPYSFGGNNDASENWKTYISYTNNQYKALVDFNVESIYIKIKENHDQLYFALAS